MPEQRQGGCMPEQGGQPVCEWYALTDGAAYPSRGREDCMPEQRQGRVHARAEAEKLLPEQRQATGVQVACSC